ncbi:MAG: hypothetical protein WBC04_23200 [Candidatus Acidiferrales bacterium]
MVRWFLKGTKWSLVSSFLTCASLIVAILLGDSQPTYTLPLHKVMAIPAFARKYGLPCSACHTAWPELNNFGQVFRDNGYQLENDRDSPIWQNPTYFPITFRITPNWHRESTDHQAVDAVAGNRASGFVERRVTQHGFDLSGMDLWTAGTLYKNISFVLLPSTDNTAAFHFEAAFVRFDNLLKSSWLNLRVGRFELDNLISEKRFLFLSANGGSYQNYHFVPVGDSNNFGIGDNQLGLELAGHATNSYTRYGVAVVSSNEGGVGFNDVGGSPNTGRTYDTYLTFMQGFQAGKLGLQRLQAFVYLGRRATVFNQTVGGAVIPATGTGNKGFYRAGFQGNFFLGKLDFLPFFEHGYDNVFLGTSTPGNQALPAGARAPTWNGGFIETHYYFNPQLVFTQRWEIVRMSQQALPGNPSDLGNVDAYSFGYRWYPIMFSRAGLAWHNEYSIVKTIGTGPLSGNGSGVPPLSLNTPVWSSSIFIGFDFDF